MKQHNTMLPDCKLKAVTLLNKSVLHIVTPVKQCVVDAKQ